MRCGLFLTVCTPSGVSVESMMYVGIWGFSSRSDDRVRVHQALYLIACRRSSPLSRSGPAAGLLFSLRGKMRRRFNYANVTATLALVFAMSGGALAAHHYLISSTKQISPKVLAALRSRAGPTGPSGPRGTTGTAGTSGE